MLSKDEKNLSQDTFMACEKQNDEMTAATEQQQQWHHRCI